MSPRPRKASDAEIFAATQDVMVRLGPSQWTLADVAGAAGVTASALVQRFGSKRGLMIALARAAAAETPARFAALRAAHRSPLAAVRAYAASMATMGEAPEGLAHHLGYLQLDLSDPELHGHVRAQARATRAAVRDLLAAAIAAGELTADADPAALARAVEVAVAGSLLTWAIHQEGTAARRVRADVDAVLAPWLAGAAGAASATRAGPRRRSGS